LLILVDKKLTGRRMFGRTLIPKCVVTVCIRYWEWREIGYFEEISWNESTSRHPSTGQFLINKNQQIHLRGPTKIRKSTEISQGDKCRRIIRSSHRRKGSVSYDNINRADQFNQRLTSSSQSPNHQQNPRYSLLLLQRVRQYQ
jgi:hypothetical protein